MKNHLRDKYLDLKKPINGINKAIETDSAREDKIDKRNTNIVSFSF